MPIFEYVCDDCGAHYEQLVLSKSTKVECPKCASGRRSLQLSVFSARTKASNGNPGPVTGGFTGGGSCCGGGGCGCH